MASGTATFIPAFKLTSVAHVAMIWATAPFVTALLAWAIIGEHPGRKVIICSLLALMGAALTVSGSFGSGSLLGDMLAFWMTLMMAGTMVVYRLWPGTPTVLPAALSSLILLPPALTLSQPMTVALNEVTILLIFGAVFALASVTLLEGTRRVPAAQAALISALETPLAPFWALIFLSEIPTFRTLLGGAIIMAAVIASQSCRNPRVQTHALRDLSPHLRRDAGYIPDH